MAIKMSTHFKVITETGKTIFCSDEATAIGLAGEGQIPEPVNNNYFIAEPEDVGLLLVLEKLSEEEADLIEKVDFWRMFFKKPNPSTEQISEDDAKMVALLKTPIKQLRDNRTIEARAFNCLKAENIETLLDLVRKTITDLLKLRNFGKKSFVVLEEMLHERGLKFGMDPLELRRYEILIEAGY